MSGLNNIFAAGLGMFILAGINSIAVFGYDAKSAKKVVAIDYIIAIIVLVVAAFLYLF